MLIECKYVMPDDNNNKNEWCIRSGYRLICRQYQCNNNNRIDTIRWSKAFIVSSHFHVFNVLKKLYSFLFETFFSASLPWHIATWANWREKTVTTKLQTKIYINKSSTPILICTTLMHAYVVDDIICRTVLCWANSAYMCACVHVCV